MATQFITIKNGRAVHLHDLRQEQEETKLMEIEDKCCDSCYSILSDMGFYNLECTCKFKMCSDCVETYVNVNTYENSETADKNIFENAMTYKGHLKCPRKNCKHTYKLIDFFKFNKPNLISRLNKLREFYLIQNTKSENTEQILNIAKDKLNNVDFEIKQNTMKNLFNNQAKQCPNCNYGPILKDGGCDNVNTHSNTHFNTCSRCGLGFTSWKKMPKWNGELPKESQIHKVPKTLDLNKFVTYGTPEIFNAIIYITRKSNLSDELIKSTKESSIYVDPGTVRIFRVSVGPNNGCQRSVYRAVIPDKKTCYIPVYSGRDPPYDDNGIPNSFKLIGKMKQNDQFFINDIKILSSKPHHLRFSSKKWPCCGHANRKTKLCAPHSTNSSPIVSGRCPLTGANLFSQDVVTKCRFFYNATSVSRKSLISFEGSYKHKVFEWCRKYTYQSFKSFYDFTVPSSLEIHNSFYIKKNHLDLLKKHCIFIKNGYDLTDNGHICKISVLEKKVLCVKCDLCKTGNFRERQKIIKNIELTNNWEKLVERIKQIYNINTNICRLDLLRDTTLIHEIDINNYHLLGNYWKKNDILVLHTKTKLQVHQEKIAVRNKMLLLQRARRVKPYLNVSLEEATKNQIRKAEILRNNELSKNTQKNLISSLKRKCKYLTDENLQMTKKIKEYKDKEKIELKLFDDIITEDGNTVIDLISDDEIEDIKELFSSSGSSGGSSSQRLALRTKGSKITIKDGYRNSLSGSSSQRLALRTKGSKITIKDGYRNSLSNSNSGEKKCRVPLVWYPSFNLSPETVPVWNKYIPLIGEKLLFVLTDVKWNGKTGFSFSLQHLTSRNNQMVTFQQWNKKYPPVQVQWPDGYSYWVFWEDLYNKEGRLATMSSLKN
jgi:hypothetical protein